MSLKRLLIETSNNIIGIYVDPEDFEDDDNINQAYELAKNTGVTILRNMELYYIKVDKKSNSVIGALFINDGSETFSFDIVVDRSYENVGHGTDLVKVAIDKYEQLVDVYGDNYYIKVHVINPTMKKLLKNKFGFEVSSELSQRESIMMYKN